MDIQVKEKLDNFFCQFKEQEYKKREIIIRPDENPKGIYYIEQGVVRRYTTTIKGDELNLNLYKKGAFFPVSWAVDEGTNNHCYDALTPVVVRKAPKEMVLKFIESEPSVLLDLLKRIYSGLDGLWTRLEYFMTGNVVNRVIVEILIYAKRFGVKKGNFIEVNLLLTENDLAAQTGIARETVSRELQKLKKKGLVEFKNKKLIINDIEKLKDALL